MLYVIILYYIILYNAFNIGIQKFATVHYLKDITSSRHWTVTCSFETLLKTTSTLVFYIQYSKTFSLDDGSQFSSKTVAVVY